MNIKIESIVIIMLIIRLIIILIIIIMLIIILIIIIIIIIIIIFIIIIIIFMFIFIIIIIIIIIFIIIYMLSLPKEPKVFIFGFDDDLTINWTKKIANTSPITHNDNVASTITENTLLVLKKYIHTNIHIK